MKAFRHNIYKIAIVIAIAVLILIGVGAVLSNKNPGPDDASVDDEITTINHEVYNQSDVPESSADRQSNPEAAVEVVSHVLSEWGVEIAETDQAPVRLLGYEATNDGSLSLRTSAYEELRRTSGNADNFDGCFAEILVLNRIHQDSVSEDIQTTPWWKNQAELEYNGAALIGDYYYYFVAPQNNCEKSEIVNSYEALKVLYVERELILEGLRSSA